MVLDSVGMEHGRVVYIRSRHLQVSPMHEEHRIEGRLYRLTGKLFATGVDMECHTNGVFHGGSYAATGSSPVTA